VSGYVGEDRARCLLANALESGYSTGANESLTKIRESFLEDLCAPTSEAEGDFVRKH